MVYDLVGTVYTASGVMLTDTEGNKYPEMVAVPGYHVNTLPSELNGALQPFVVTAVTPTRVFAGRDDTVCLKFVDRAEWLALGYEVVEEVV